MKGFKTFFILASIAVLVFSLSAVPAAAENKVITKDTLPTLSFDIRGKWEVRLTWDEPPIQKWTIDFKGTQSSGTFKGVSSPHGHIWEGTYKVTGLNVVFNQDPSTVDTGSGGISFPINCTGKFTGKTAMEGTFKCGPDTGTWKAFRRIILQPLPAIKK